MPTSHRTVRGLLAALLATVLGLVLVPAGLAQTSEEPSEEEASDPAAQRPDEDEIPILDIVEVDGPIDAFVRDFVLEALDRAERVERIDGILLRINTPGALGTDGFALAEAVRDSSVPVITWVGAAGADAGGAGVLLMAASHYAGMARDTTVGPINPEDLKSNTDLSEADVRRQLDALINDRAGHERSVDAYLDLLDASMTSIEARDAGIIEYTPQTLQNAIVEVDEQAVVLADGEVITIDTVETRGSGDTAESVVLVLPRLSGLTAVKGFLHNINTPTYAYALLVIALAAIAFEFFASSIGLSGILGGIVLIGSFQSMGNLPMNWWAVALIAAGVLFMCIDVQLSNLNVPTVLGTALAVLGSIYFTSSGVYRVHWWAILLVIGGLVLFFAIAMTTVVKTRFSTPTIGRGALLGARGTAHSELTPEGLVEIDGAVWRGRSHRGRIHRGDAVTVRAIDGLVLEVDEEPEDAEPEGTSA